MLLTVHVEPDLLALNGQREACPAARQFAHLEGDGLLRAGGPGLGVVQNHALGPVLHRSQRHSQLHRPLQRISNGEQHSSAPRAGSGCHRDGEVSVERVGDEGACQAAHVSVRTEAVGWETLEARDEGHRWWQRNTDELGQVQLTARVSLWTEGEQSE